MRVSSHIVPVVGITTPEPLPAGEGWGEAEGISILTGPSNAP